MTVGRVVVGRVDVGRAGDLGLRDRGPSVCGQGTCVDRATGWGLARRSWRRSFVGHVTVGCGPMVCWGLRDILIVFRARGSTAGSASGSCMRVQRVVYVVWGRMIPSRGSRGYALFLLHICYSCCYSESQCQE